MASNGKNIVLGVTGSIAAYKAADLTSQLTKLGHEVHVVMTDDAAAIMATASSSFRTA